MRTGIGWFLFIKKGSQRVQGLAIEPCHVGDRLPLVHLDVQLQALRAVAGLVVPSAADRPRL